jgi:hypothetical protein
MAIPAAGLFQSAGQNPAYTPSGATNFVKNTSRTFALAAAVSAAVIPQFAIKVGTATT